MKRACPIRSVRLCHVWAVTAVALVLVFLFASVSYADSDAVSDKNRASSIFLSTNGSVFSLRVPTKLPFCPADNGGAYCADDTSITCFTSGGADIKSVSISPPDGWKLSSIESSASESSEKCASFRFQDTDIPKSGNADILSFSHIEGKGDTPFTYGVKTSDPSDDIYSVLCADAVITVGWKIIY